MKLTTGREPRNNWVFCLLPEEVRARLRSAREPVTLHTGAVLHESGQRMEYVYFPTSSVISLVCTTESGTAAEAGLIGHEGVVGLPAVLGGEVTLSRAVVVVAGSALRLPVEVAQEEFRRGGAFQFAVLRYVEAVFAQISQMTVCSSLHPVEKRLCRWLLMMRDRVGCSEVLVTQEQIAHMLGVRREGVTAAARHLQEAGLIRYSRGHIEVRASEALEAESCECYRVVRAEFDRLLPRRGREERCCELALKAPA